MGTRVVGHVTYESDREMRIQWNSSRSCWMLDHIGAPAPFRILDREDQEFPVDGVWTHYQGTRHTRRQLLSKQFQKKLDDAPMSPQPNGL